MPAEPFDALLRFGEENNCKAVTPAKHAELLSLDSVVSNLAIRARLPGPAPEDTNPRPESGTLGFTRLPYFTTNAVPAGRKFLATRRWSDVVLALKAEVLEWESKQPPERECAVENQGGQSTKHKHEGKVVDLNTPEESARRIKDLQPAARKAYLAFAWAESTTERKLLDREAYDMVKEQGIPESLGDVGELEDYELPEFETWTKHLRNARATLGEQKYSRRPGRAQGKSIVLADEMEHFQ